MLTAIVFIGILALLIIAHELGHFWSARKFGVKVEEFGIGYPPRIWKKQKGETAFSINALPLGGFVKIFGEDDNQEKAPRSFAAQAIWKRAVILAAGVFMNFILAYFLIMLILSFGTPTAFDGPVPQGAKDASVKIDYVQKDSPADKAGFSIGDSINKITDSNSQSLEPSNFIGQEDALEQIQKFIGERKGQELKFVLRRGSSDIETSAVPRTNPPKNEGALGISMIKVAVAPAPPLYLLPWEGLKTMGNLLVLFGGALGDIFKELVTQGKISESVSGPVGIVKITSQTLPLGWLYIVQLIAIISLNLAVINILPFPALDGGRLLFLGIEKIRGKAVNKEVERMANMVGFFLLIIFMILVTIKDIGRLF